MKNTVQAFLFACLLWGTTCQSQDKRYQEQLFDQVGKTTVVYGKNTTQKGEEKVLDMDIYTPQSDTDTNRPLVLLAHGGGFTRGNKESLKYTGLIEYLAKSGYVVASITYRLIDIEVTQQARGVGVIQAVQDMKAALRFFGKSVKEGNTYGINPDAVFIGGYSAGAITALHTAYIENEAEVAETTPGFEQVFPLLGGLEGNSGNSGYTIPIKGVINIAGGLISVDYLDKGEPALHSTHGTADDIVPIGQGQLAGSQLIHDRAQKEGVPETLNAVEGGKHNVINNCEPCFESIRKFLLEQMGKL